MCVHNAAFASDNTLEVPYDFRGALIENAVERVLVLGAADDVRRILSRRRRGNHLGAARRRGVNEHRIKPGFSSLFVEGLRHLTVIKAAQVKSAMHSPACAGGHVSADVLRPIME